MSGVTTTDSLGASKAATCQACGKRVRGDVLVGNGYGQFVGACHADRFGREELERLIPSGTPEPEQDDIPAPITRVLDVLNLGAK